MLHRRFPVAVTATALLGLSTIGGLCGPGLDPDSPQETTSCGQGEAPADGADTIAFGQPGNPSLPLEDGSRLPMEYGNQGGQHVYVGVRLYAAQAGTWTYKLLFLRESSDEGTSSAGYNNLAVHACSQGWTETTLPVFMDHDTGGEGVLGLIATNSATGMELTAQVALQIQ